MSHVLKRKAGFTLIELLVTIGIMAVVMGAGTAVFSGFSKKKDAQAAARELQVFLRSAQNYARVGTIPSGCTRPLVSYDVVFTTGGTGTMNARCTSSSNPLDTVSIPLAAKFSRAGTFPVSVGTDETFTLRFLPLYAGAELALDNSTFVSTGTTPASIIISRGGLYIHTITVGSGGAVSDPVGS
jgi:prepilin-type N-terminal cleavage/methylation domain-containing protein